MSDIDARPAPSRGRSSARGGRGGFGRGGPRGGHRPSNGAANEVSEPSIEEDQGELGELKKQYSSQLSLLKDMFPDWTDADLVMALQETDGDLQITVDRITEGHVSQFSEIKKPKDRARSKAKETPSFSGADYATSAVRGGRGRGGFDSTRGGRGRGDRGRGGARGGRGGAVATNGAPRDTSAVSVPTTESAAWESATAAEPATSAWESAPAAKEETANQGAWGDVMTAETTPATASEGAKSSLIPDGAPKKTWASMFAQLKPALAPAPVATQQPMVPGPLPAELAQPSVPVEAETVPEEPREPTPEPAAPSPVIEAPAEPQPQQSVPELEQPQEDTEAVLSAPQDPLTEDNLENLPDSSIPPATHTAASTVGSLDPRTITPMLGPGQQAPIGRPPLGGYASSAYRAAGLAGRSASFQRRVLDQQEAVVMPGHNAVDRAAVQFGSMGLNGDNEGLDVDDEREEPETRTQPPQQSPPGQPRASLPPAPIQAPAPQHDAGLPESLPTPKQAPGLPPVAQHQQQQQQQHQQPYGMQQESAQSAGAPQHQPQDTMSNQGYSQYARFGQPEAAAPAQKSYDPFSHQTPSSSFDQYSSHQSQPAAAQQQGYGGFSSAPSDYSQYYTADQQRNAYQNYYGSSYGQQSAQPQQDSGASQQRTSGSIGVGSTDSPYSSNQSAQQAQQSHSRYGDTQGSGQNTPQPLMGGQQHSAAPTQGMNQQQQQQLHQAQQQYNSAFPYGHPYYQSPYQTAYQNQFGYSPGYGAQYGNKGGMHGGQPHGYGMNAPSSYDNSSSPAAGGFGQQSSMQSRESGLTGGLGDYGRTSSTQPSGLGSSSFGSDPFARSQSGYQGQSQGYGQQQSAPSEELKPFGDSKGTGPSPALGGQPGRPGSAANSIGAQSQASAPPPQGHQQQGFGAYPGFNQGSQYGGGLGGLGVHQGQGQQGQGQGGYGAYGGGFGNSYSQQYGRGGWGGSYGH